MNCAGKSRVSYMSDEDSLPEGTPVGDAAREDTDRSGATQTVTARGRWDQSVGPSTAIIETIAAATDSDPRSLPPLYDYVDSESLDTLMTSDESGSSQVRVSFRYEGHDIAVSSAGDIEITVQNEDSD